ncbi:hypothetical protein ACQUZK_09280, partial [Streptococcus pyogenes]|uniref:hypothetical protein n=1 Tax=Streptococcus pyogenes TaxID=1314 RepID=UPI003DA12ED1
MAMADSPCGGARSRLGTMAATRVDIEMNGNRMSRIPANTLAGVLCAASVAFAATPPPASAAAPSAEAPGLTRTVVMSGLQNPWDVAFTPDGVMLFTEKCRGLSARLADGKTVRLFGTSGSALVAPD